MTARLRLLAVFTLLATSTPSLKAVPHLHPETYPNAKPCHLKQFSPAQIQLAGSLRAAIINNATGAKNIAVILVRFNGAGSSTSGPSNGDITASGLANFQSYFDAMKSYYSEVSTGKLSLTFSFFGTGAGVAATGVAHATDLTGAYPLNNPMEYYGCGDVDPGCPGVSPTAPAGLGGAYLIHDALLAARQATGGPTSNTPPNLGTFDAVLVMHAGHGNETTAMNGDIWSALYEEPTVIGAGGTTFTDGAEFPELENTQSIPPITSPMGVMCHEFGHMLTLSDLYNTAVLGGTSVVGKWDLMDAGPYLGGGANPAHMGAWDRKHLGWETPQPLTSQVSATLHPVTQTATVPTMLYLGGPTEYFLVEYRSQTAGTFDQQIPGTGILIWHIDDAITAQRGFNGPDPNTQNTINTGSPHYGVSVVTADGVTLSNANQGTSTNLFPNGRSKFDSPLSDLFDGSPTGIILANILGVGTNAVTFDAASLSGTDGVSILKLTSYPNPAGAKYPHPNGPGHATIQLQLSKPANDYQINIYTLSGDLVRKIGKNDIAFQLLDRSSNNKFVYEYVWDLTNGDGAHVAPGVYLLLARADGQSKSAKAVVIR